MITLYIGNSAEKSPNNKKPNTVLIITDNQEPGDISTHDKKATKTPSMDKMHDKTITIN